MQCQRHFIRFALWCLGTYNGFMDFSLFLISNDAGSHQPLQENLPGLPVNFFDGTNYPSFSQLVNHAVVASPTEYVILMSDKVMPQPQHIYKILDLLNHGFALVGLYNFACFGLSKQLFREIGCFDERYVGGGFEDYDFIVRILEANLAFYLVHEVPFFPKPSKWRTAEGKYPGWDHWIAKWIHHYEYGNPVPKLLERSIPEQPLFYDLGPAQPISWLKGRENCISESTDTHVTPFLSMDIK